MKLATKYVLMAFIMGAVFCITGCGTAVNIANNTIIIDKNGTITGAIVDDFSKEHYESTGLEAMIEEELSEYNKAANGENITLEKFEITSDRQAKVFLRYLTDEDYKAFNNKMLFVGTVSEAYSAGYEFPDMNGISATEVLEKGSMNLVIFEEPVHVKTTGKIAYVSNGVKIVGAKEAEAGETEAAQDNYFYVIYE